MATEREKMVSGALYNASDPELARSWRSARELLRAFNASHDEQQDERQRILRALFGAAGEGVSIEPPFFCDYGGNIAVGARVFFNFNCVILDPAPVTIGSDVLFGPGVQIYTATHPINPRERRSGLEAARPIVIGSDVWVGGAAILCPGVRVGDRSVIGAGSVVTGRKPSALPAARSARYAYCCTRFYRTREFTSCESTSGIRSLGPRSRVARTRSRSARAENPAYCPLPVMHGMLKI